MFQIPGPDSDAHFDDLFSDDSHDTGPDEPDSPTVLLDKKTRRRFLDLGLVSYKFRATKKSAIKCFRWRLDYLSSYSAQSL